METSDIPEKQPSAAGPGKETSSQPKPLPLRRRLRWWIPLLIVGIAVANVVRPRLSADLDGMFKNMQTWLTGMGTAGLLLVWWIFLTRLRWRTRLISAALAVLCVFGLKQLVRLD